MIWEKAKEDVPFEKYPKYDYFLGKSPARVFRVYSWMKIVLVTVKFFTRLADLKTRSIHNFMSILAHCIWYQKSVRENLINWLFLAWYSVFDFP